MPYLNKLLTLTVLSLTFFSFTASLATEAVLEKVQSRFAESIAYGTKGDKSVAKISLRSL